MNIKGVSIAACAWQSGDFDPLVRKDKKGRWTFLSEEFDMKNDKNFARQTLERALFKRMKGTLNPLNFREPEFTSNFVLASDKACVVVTSESGEQCVRVPHSNKPVRLHIVLPLFEITGALQREMPPDTDIVTKVYYKREPFLAVVQEVLQLRQEVWTPLVRQKDNRPMRPNNGDLVSQLQRLGAPADIIERFKQSSNEDYWRPSQQDLKRVA